MAIVKFTIGQEKEYAADTAAVSGPLFALYISTGSGGNTNQPLPSLQSGSRGPNSPTVALSSAGDPSNQQSDPAGTRPVLGSRLETLFMASTRLSSANASETPSINSIRCHYKCR
jgi:hypothetical protein